MPTSTHKEQWTKPFYGVQHLGRFSTNPYQFWATVTNRKTWAELTCWVPARTWESPRYMFNTLEEALEAGEKYVRTGMQPNKRHMGPRRI